MSIKRIPISVCKEISRNYKQSQVILITWDAIEGRTHVVTYGESVKDCEQAAIGGNKLKKALGWPESMCNAVPTRARKSQEVKLNE